MRIIHQKTQMIEHEHFKLLQFGLKYGRKAPTCSDQHQVGHGGPVELIVRDEGDIPAGGDSGLVRESQEQAVVVVDEVDVLDVA